MRLLLKAWFRSNTSIWSISALVLVVVLLGPIVSIFGGFNQVGPEWSHIASSVLPTYLVNTLILIICVSIVSILFAVPTAWFLSMYDFRGFHFWRWALVLPLAMPSYVAAFIYFDFLDYGIPLIIEVRNMWGFDASQWAEKVIRYGLLIILLSSVLYPYLFLSLRTSFSRQQAVFIDAARILGKSSRSVFWRIGLPLARPMLFAGLSLIIMEVVNDYGAVHFFGVPTLTEGIFRTWFGLGDRVSALQIAGLAMFAVFVFLGLEYWQRNRQQFTEGSLNSQPPLRLRLNWQLTVFVNALCFIPFMIGFLVPLAVLFYWAFLSYDGFDYGAFFKQASSSLIFASLTAICVTLLAFFLLFCSQVNRGFWFNRFLRSATFGYAIPGAVIAIGVMDLFGRLDQVLPSNWVLSGSLFAIFFAYIVRFLTVAYQPINAGMKQVCGSFQEASLTLGQSHSKALFKIYYPLLKTTLIGSAILVFIDIVKELPLTLILRPANFETLSTYAFGFAKEGQIYDCALPSLMIVGISGIGLVFMNRWIEKSQDI